MDKKPAVSVVMITYNHEDYIQEAIEGVLIQKTDFNIELIIANDASPDNTDSVVESIKDNYKGNINIRYYNHKQNKGVSDNFIWALKQVRGKYIAICEGDDYWTDPLKLQKQVDFLEENEFVGLVSTLRKNFSQKKGLLIKEKQLDKNIEICTFNDLILTECRIATLTVLFRTILINDFIKFREKVNDNIYSLDYTIWLYISYHSKIAILNKYTAVYRILENSLSHQKNKWMLKRQYFNDFLLLTKEFNIQNNKNVKKAKYLRAKSFYLIACEVNDKTNINLIKQIFLNENDYYRFFLTNITCKVKSLIPIILLINRFLLKISPK